MIKSDKRNLKESASYKCIITISTLIIDNSFVENETAVVNNQEVFQINIPHIFKIDMFTVQFLHGLIMSLFPKQLQDTLMLSKEVPLKKPCLEKHQSDKAFSYFFGKAWTWVSGLVKSSFAPPLRSNNSVIFQPEVIYRHRLLAYFSNIDHIKRSTLKVRSFLFFCTRLSEVTMRYVTTR